MTLPAVHASLSHLIDGQYRNKTAVFDAIKGVIAAYSQKNDTAFNGSMNDLCSAVESTFLTMAAIHDTARTAAGLPYEPKVEIPAGAATIISENQSAEDTAATRRSRATRTSVGEGE